MKLERYKDKKETRKKVILISLTMLTLISITMVLYKTFAKFTTTTSFTIMSGKVVYKKKGPDFGVDIPVVEEESGDGLFAVEHLGSITGWDQTEYRYGGNNVNNYVIFNSELWRIIGLVNVKTSSNKIEQRIKIIKNESIGRYGWDNLKINGWTKSELMRFLNDTYYQSLEESAKDMIDKEISWNLGGWDTTEVTTDDIYVYERGTKVYSENPNEWNKDNTINRNTGKLDSNLFKGIGLMYASDYGYAVGGDERSVCLKTTLKNYPGDTCVNNNWLKVNPPDWSEWCLTPISSRQAAFSTSTYGPVIDCDTWAGATLHTRPVVFLNKNVKISKGEGSQQTPYQLLVS